MWTNTIHATIMPQEWRYYGIYKAHNCILMLLMQCLLKLKHLCFISIWTLRTSFYNLYHLCYFFLVSQTMLHKGNVDSRLTISMLICWLACFRLSDSAKTEFKIVKWLLFVLTFKIQLSGLWMWLQYWRIS